MVDEEALAILRQGAGIWNEWRAEQEESISGIHHIDLSESELSGADLSEANLIGVDLSKANLYKAYLYKTDLSRANLYRADLSKAILIEAKLVASYLYGTRLRETNLAQANLSESDLIMADLINSDLYKTNLSEAILRDADFQYAICGGTSFSNVDLSVAKNLGLAWHRGPSRIDIDTLYKSNGNIPREFLEGCGVPESMITFMKSLVGTAIEYYSCFISYSTQDDDFARQLNARLKDNGLRVWYAPEEMKGGQKIHEQLYEGIRLHDKLILVLSEASMNSTWVQTEIKRARKHERDENRRKLFPISLVPFEQIRAWELFDGDEGRDLAQEIREYYIPDFSQWKDYDRFTAEFDKLLKALRADESGA